MANNAVLKKIVYRVELKFVSPINVSSGHEGMTDSDVIRDYDGKPFIPGTSIAGALRDYVSIKNLIFGSSEDDGKMSSIIISDLEFNDDPVINYRDSVALNDDKTTIEGAKFDFEALEGENTKGYFYMELTIRDGDNQELYTNTISEIISGIQRHEIRLGSNKTRGYGVIEVIKLQKKEYTKDNYLDYAKAYKSNTWPDIKEESLDELILDSKWVHIEVPLKQRGGISIRKYLIEKDSPDYESITDHGLPVIPGTSFNGAIRHRVLDILRSLDGFDASDVINEMFGFVNKDEAHVSRIIIDETVINNAKPLKTVRTSVSRFEGAVKIGALYLEKTYVDGDLVLRIAVPKASEKDVIDENWIIGFILLAIKDIQNGFLAVGGQTAIGRGLFKANGKIKIDGMEDREDEYISSSLSLYKKWRNYDHKN